MARYKTFKVAFKANHQYQGMLLPTDINDLIATDHPVRVLNEVLERIDITELIRPYKPGFFFKILLYIRLSETGIDKY